MPRTRTTTPPDTDRQPRAAATKWPLERVLFALAGTMTLLSVALTAFVSPWFLLLAAFVAINQWLYVTVGNCPASLVFRRLGVAQPCSR
jgi:Zn-dependent protease